jgi:acetylornithine deacetylase
VDPLDVVALTRSLVDIDSTTGFEADAGRWLAAYLRGRGFLVTEQPVDGTRANVYATPGTRTPRVVLSTHVDCVPPFFGSRMEGGRLYGRGSCDAKGILAAQVTAAERLRAAGHDAFGLLFVVGEERGSDGAAAANATSPGSAFLINGEPTDNRLGLATRGVLRVRLRALGRAAHSSYPELGESAIEKLLDALVALRGIDWPSDPALGRTHYTVGVIEGGVAPNVVPPWAHAEVLFRTVGEAEVVRRCFRALPAGVVVEEVLEVPPVRLTTVPGFDTATFPYTTDVPLLDAWGQPLLYGPGSVLVAHTADEYVPVEALGRAVDDYVRLVETLSSGAS